MGIRQEDVLPLRGYTQEYATPEEDLVPRIAKLLCPFCSTPFTAEMVNAYNGTYGCETGCEWVTVEVNCSHCKRLVYEDGAFGDKSTWTKRDSEDWLEEFGLEVERIKKEQL